MLIHTFLLIYHSFVLQSGFVSISLWFHKVFFQLPLSRLHPWVHTPYRICVPPLQRAGNCRVTIKKYVTSLISNNRFSLKKQIATPFLLILKDKQFTQSLPGTMLTLTSHYPSLFSPPIRLTQLAIMCGLVVSLTELMDSVIYSPII